MEENIANGISAVESDKQSGFASLKIAIVVAYIISICGIGLGVYSIIKGLENNDRVSELETRIASINDNRVDIDTSFNFIKYSTGGGFGTEAMCATVTVKIDSEGKIEYTNSYKEDYKEYSQISSEAYSSLVNYIKDHINDVSLTDEGDILDGGSSYIVIGMNGGGEYEIGGYGATVNDDFYQMKLKIIEAVGEEEYNSYSKTVHSLDS